MSRTVIKIGPRDHGRRMRLEDFDRAEIREGFLYELSRGVITVSDVPNDRHFAQIDVLRDQVHIYRVTHPGIIHRIGSGADCKISLVELESERHPDLAIYKTARPLGEDFWSRWIPEIVIEVVSPGSERRDYEEKREEYLAFGVREYWIIDAERQEVLVLRRRGKRWSERVLGRNDVYQTPLLPGFELTCAPIFDAAGAAGE